MTYLSVIIPIHDRLVSTKKSLSWLIDSLERSEISNETEIIIVDDGSSDGSDQWIRKNYPDITILKGEGNLWWSGAINLGVKYALQKLKSRYILLWNNDIKPHIDYFTNLFKILSISTEPQIFGSKVLYLNEPDRIFSLGGYFNPQKGQAGIHFHRQPDKWGSENIHWDVDWCGGMGTVIPREVFEKVGLFNEIDFPQYKGDFDYCVRVRGHNLKIVLYNSLVIYNDTSTTGVGYSTDILKMFTNLFNNGSRYNISVDYKFFIQHARSSLWFINMVLKYIKYILASILCLVLRENLFKQAQLLFLKNK